MNRYLKLVVMELQRFWKIYAGLAILTVISQIGGTVYGLSRIMDRIDRIMAQQGYQTYAEFKASNFIGFEGFQEAANQSEPWLSGPIFLCIAALIGYSFFIWYRDWTGKSTFAYRLLMLPTSRMNLYWSKLTALMLFVLGLIALQLLVLPILIGLYHQIVPQELILPETVRSFLIHDRVFKILVPPTFMGFLVSYGTGLISVIVLFTAILIERSYRRIGIVGGIVYAGICAALLLTPGLVNSFESAVLYPFEIFMLQLAVGLVLLASSLALSHYLLTRKITV